MSNARQSGLRRVAALHLPDAVPNALPPERPDVRWVDPRSLLIEGDYQRDLSRKSVDLIRRMATGWDWAAMKPPICAETADGALVIIDGQHTAIGAASHPAVSEIPAPAPRIFLVAQLHMDSSRQPRPYFSGLPFGVSDQH